MCVAGGEPEHGNACLSRSLLRVGRAFARPCNPSAGRRPRRCVRIGASDRWLLRVGDLGRDQVVDATANSQASAFCSCPPGRADE
jgi:hypothetical protein